MEIESVCVCFFIVPSEVIEAIFRLFRIHQKFLRKSSQILARKIPESKASNAKKSFDHPLQLKSGVPRPLGSQAPRTSRHAWKIRPTVVSQGIQLGCGGPDDNDDDDDNGNDVDDTVMMKWTSGLELRVTPENLSLKNSKSSVLFSRTQFLTPAFWMSGYAGDSCSLVFLISRLIASTLDRCEIPILSYNQTPLIRTVTWP